MKSSALLLSAILTTSAASSRACDICACYLGSDTHVVTTTGWYLATSAQFTHFGTLQMDGHEVPNPAHQHLDSTIVQGVVGYAFTDRFSLQVNVPFIYRDFRRPEGFEIDRGSVSGLGDLSLIGSYQILRRDSKEETISWRAAAGLKFPTGDSDRIAEELNEMEVEGAPESGIHGHDLTLGSGSWDGVIGTSFYMRRKRAFLSGSVQYAIRGEGDFDYRFANEVSWEAGPGYYLVFEPSRTLGLQVALSGEHKGTDTFQGESAEDTGITAVYLGPKVFFTWRDRISAEAGVDIPVHMDNTALQAVPDYRVHAALTFRF